MKKINLAANPLLRAQVIKVTGPIKEIQKQELKESW